MFQRSRALLACALVACLIPAMAHAQITPYGQNFETLSPADGGALSGDGWLVFANVFSPDGLTYYYGYGPFPAPNGTGAFCDVVTGQGGASQGANQLVTYSDYANGDQGVGNRIETNVYQEWAVDGSNVGQNWIFDFDAKKGNLELSSTALAFIKTLDPNAGYAMTNFVTVDMTNIPATWSHYQISIAVDASLAGQVLQIGFLTNASNYEGSGIFYDNINFNIDGVIPVDNSSWGELKSKF